MEHFPTMAVFSFSRPRLAANMPSRPSSLCFLLLLLLLIMCQGYSFVPVSQPPSTPRTTTSLYFFFASSARDPTNNDNDDNGLPYIIERIAEQPNEQVFEDISNMCINVFFKEQITGKSEDTIAPWKEAQISYLKILQTADLRRRRQRYPQTNQMFIAYQVLEAEASTALSRPLILDLNRVYNLPSSRSSDQEYVRGGIFGFVEVTQRPYGVGRQVDHADETEAFRPVLTNLAVSSKARQSGIGSQLLEECERHIGRVWNLNEVVLEVEDYNTNALEFYGKRGYKVIFSDPASRRYDVNGLVLRKVRCTREILRKTLTVQQPQTEGTIADDEGRWISFGDFVKQWAYRSYVTQF